ncbi:hypothetical protein BB560_004602 [Smittium megazygosporum]|uniref:PUM-HD domain-containing protein n=1 Tax=Smittium megazygosporum TaxID=133381 RepID=A0A2T9Z8U3_9FUNG|nr:hypothetical protein BB560_004602 [Smittium megazygosporum]
MNNQSSNHTETKCLLQEYPSRDSVSIDVNLHNSSSQTTENSFSTALSSFPSNPRSKINLDNLTSTSSLLPNTKIPKSDYSTISLNRHSSLFQEDCSATKVQSSSSSQVQSPSNPDTNFDPSSPKETRKRLLDATSKDTYSSQEEFEISESSSSFDTWKKLIKFAEPEYKALFCAIALLLVSSSVTMLLPYIMGKIIDIVTNPDLPAPFGLTITQIFTGLVCVFSFSSLANFGRIYLIRRSGESMIFRLRNLLYEKMVYQDSSFFETNRSGDLVSRLTVDTSIVSKSITNNLSDGMRSFISFFAGLSMMVYMSPKLTLIMMLIVPIISGYAVTYGRYIKNISQKTQTAIGTISKQAEERLSSIRIVQSFGREKEEALSFNQTSQHIFDLGKKEAWASGIFFGSNGFLGNISILMFLGFGGRMVLNGEITIGNLASFMLYTAFVGGSLSGLTSFFSESMKGIGASNRLFYILERPPKIKIEDSGLFFGPQEQGGIGECTGHIQFENVNFSYPSRPDVQVFKDLNIDIKPRTHVAIAGPSGQGKTTMAWLLLRMYDIQSGSIKIDGHDLKSLNLNKWRSSVGIVPQEPSLFATTIRNNLLYANPNASAKDLQVALSHANAWDFVNAFPNGLDTFVGERGISLSGGQKQRIAIARALLLNPSVLILDEATSALDSQSEQSVQIALDRLISGNLQMPSRSLNSSRPSSPTPESFPLNCTVITIAHRQSTLQKSDYLFVLGENGSVVESGTYSDLASKPDDTDDFEHSQQDTSSEEINSDKNTHTTSKDKKGSKLYSNESKLSSSAKNVEKRQLKEQRKQSKPGYQMISELKSKWEIFRRGDLDANKKKKALSEAIDLIKGKIKDVTFKHDCSRIIQSILKRGDSEQRNLVAQELDGSYLDLTNAKYGKFIILGILKYCPSYRQKVISSFYGNVRKMMRQKESAFILEECYSVRANASQQSRLISEFYGPEFAVFNPKIDAHSSNSKGDNNILTVSKIISANQGKRDIVMKNLKESINTFLNKESVHLSIVHKCILEYMLNANLKEAQEMTTQLRESVVEILHTKDGAKAGAYCLFYSTPKQYTKKICCEEFGHWCLLAALESMDDTVFMNKSIISEITAIIDDLASDKFGRRVLFFILRGRDRKYIGPDAINLLAAGDPIRKQTCKKDDNTRKTELVDGISSKLLEWVSTNAQTAIFSPFESQLLVESLVSCKGDKTAAIDSVCKVIKESNEKTLKGHNGDVLPEESIFMNITSSRALSVLIKSSKDTDSEILLAILNTILETPGLIGKLSKSGVFLIVNLLESPATSEITKSEIIADLKNPQKELKKFMKQDSKPDKTGSASKKKKLNSGESASVESKPTQSVYDIMIKLLA